MLVSGTRIIGHLENAIKKLGSNRLELLGGDFLRARYGLHQGISVK
jgi:hypothetical protein